MASASIDIFPSSRPVETHLDDLGPNCGMVLTISSGSVRVLVFGETRHIPAFERIAAEFRALSEPAQIQMAAE